MEDHRTCRLAVVGSAGVGKSALVNRFVLDVFINGYDPTVEDEWTQTVKIDDEKQMLDITDTGGDDEFRHTLNRHARENDGFIIVYSVDKRDSFLAIERDFLDTIRMNATGGLSRIPPIVLVANKTDLANPTAERASARHVKVTEAEGQHLAQRLHVPIFEASAKDNTAEAVGQIFEQACREALNRKILKRGDLLKMSGNAIAKSAEMAVQRRYVVLNYEALTYFKDQHVWEQAIAKGAVSHPFRS